MKNWARKTVEKWLKETTIPARAYTLGGLLVKDDACFSAQMISWEALEANSDIADVIMEMSPEKTPFVAVLQIAVAHLFIQLRNGHNAKHMEGHASALMRVGRATQPQKTWRSLCDTPLIQAHHPGLQTVAGTSALLLHDMCVRLRGVARRRQKCRSARVQRVIDLIRFRPGSRSPATTSPQSEPIQVVCLLI